MASQAAGRDVPKAPRDEPESSEPQPNHPEPACQEAQKWIEAVTGKSFGDKDFRSALENGILLCELLSAIKPGLVKKINRLPTPIAGLDNLSVFLRGCEELGLRGSQLFDPGDLQDTSIRANLKDSDCNRKLKNVLNTVFWLGKAASGCASYSGPTLNLKEFEGLLAQMKVESEEGGDGAQKRGVRDSGYDCWDSERSDSLSPPRHTRDNSLDSLDSFGSRSQHSPSPDVVNRGNSDGRGSDSEADAPSRKPDVRKDDMLARRTASSESRSSIPFNQFLPNRTNVSSYIPTQRRKPHTEEGEQRSQPQATPEQVEGKRLHFKTAKTVTWAPENNGEKLNQEEEKVAQDILEQRRLQKLEKAGIKLLPAAARYSSPPTTEEQKVRSPSPNIILRRDNDFLNSQKSAWDSSSDGEDQAEVQKVPDVRRDDLASRRAPRGPVAPKVHQFIPPPVCSNKDRERWEGIRRASQQTLQEKEISQVEGDNLSQTAPKSADLPLWTPDTTPTPAELDARLAQYEMRAEEEDEEEEERIPDLQKDDMMARRTRVFHKQSTSTATCNRFLPVPASKRCTQGVVTTDAAPRNKKEVQTDRSKKLNVRSFSHRVEQHQPRDPMETPQPHPVTEVIRSTSHSEHEYDDDDDENEPVPDVQKDDMMARRMGSSQKKGAARTNQCFSQFLPVPGSVKYNIAPVSGMKQLHNKPKLPEKMASESIVTVAAESQASPSKAPRRMSAGLRERREEEEEEDGKQKGEMTIPNTSVTDVTEPLSSKTITPPPSPATAPTCKEKAEVEKRIVEERVEEKVEERKGDVNEQPHKKPFWLEDEDLPPMMMSRRVAFMSEDTESVSMSDMLNDDEVGHLPQLSQSRYERMQEQYSNFQDDEDQWQNELVRWKNRRRSASQELIKKEEERKRIEKRMKEEGSDCNKRKSIKTYKEIVEEKERREAELCEAYRNAASPEEAAMVLQRYALRFTISDATLDSLKLPRSTAKPKPDPNQVDKEHKPVHDSETLDPLHKPESTVTTDQKHTKPEDMEIDKTAQQETSDAVSSSSSTPKSPLPSVPSKILQIDKTAQQETSDVVSSSSSTPKSPVPSKILQIDKTAQQETSDVVSSSSSTPKSPLPSVTHSENMPPQSQELREPQTQPIESPSTHEQPMTVDAQPQTKHTPPQIAQVQPHTTPPVHTLPSPPSVSSRPVPLLAAKPYCQPKTSQSGQKPVKMDGLVRVNGEATEDLSVSTPPASPLHSSEENKDVTSKQTETEVPSEETAASQDTVEKSPPPRTEKPTSSSGSAISSLLGGRNCVTTTTIVTELTQTHMEPHPLDVQSNGQVNGTMASFGKPAEEKKAQPVASPCSMQEYSPTVTEGLEESNVTIETPMLNLAKRVNHWVWDPNEERTRLERWQQEQERLLQEQYQREQEKLKKEWEKAQLEVEEEERKHNEEERKILEETVTPLNPSGLFIQQPGQTGMTSSAPEKSEIEGKNVPLQQNGQRISTGNEDQHASKLHFFQDSACDGEPSKKQELWKTSSLDRNPQLIHANIVKRSGSHDTVIDNQQSSSSSPQPPSPSRCVSGKRLCTGCSQPLGKGAAMIIDTLGLFFHMQCFKCGVCEGQLGDATAGTDVRIRNGLLSCHDCYIASRGRGQPTTL
ncbi:LIM and calponin homology domains-containing protein 1-like isoform X7 [Thunnus albacares]|uniref:LIM and calponin homology domains-containing protein 1-like isoform X7 n=1 Tax=Thunnus albacares TaxID=8236 RepID=UPI001CF6DA99|nr:LIM and calponin homology domains-containing protein 1-like isoform X7 [Thunnus albacares]